jgi:hypothetical protein
MGQFCAVMVWMVGRRECSRSQIVPCCHEPVKRVHDGIVFEIKKETPIDQAKQDPAQTIATRTE